MYREKIKKMRIKKKKLDKGMFGYFTQEKKWTILRTVLYFALSLAIFLIGYITTKSKVNLMTVVAVLGCLPASKSAVNMIMFLKTKECSDKVYQTISQHGTNLIGLYDLYFTSYEHNFLINHMIVFSNTLCAYTEPEHKWKAEQFEKHIQKMVLQDGKKDITVKLFTDLDKYVKRMDEAESLVADQVQTESLKHLLLSVSL